MNLRGGGGGAIAKATRWGRVGAFVAGKEGLCGPACGGGEESRQAWRGQRSIRLGSCCVRKGGWVFQRPSGCSVENGRLQGCRREAEEALSGVVEMEKLDRIGGV